MKIPEKAAQHFVYGTYYIKNDTEVKEVESISVKGSKVDVIIKRGEKTITQNFNDVTIKKNGPELILKPSSQYGVTLVMEFAKMLKELKDRYGNEYFTFQYSGVHVSGIQALRKKSGIFTKKRSGKSLDENDIKVASPDNFYKKLLESDESIIKYDDVGNILEEVQVGNGNKKITLKITRKGIGDDNVFLIPSK